MSESSPIQTISNDYSHYTPLSSESKEVRLLRILPAALPEAPLVIALIRTKLATCPPYTALSYCWGSLDETESITILFQESVELNLTGDDNTIEELNRTFKQEDGRRDIAKDFKVTTNLHAALNSFRSRNITGFIWADMLCINQNDEDEKSEQVPKMGEIYGGATKVYAWLGEADHQIDCIFAVLQKFRDRKREGKFPTHFDAAEQLSFYRQLFRDIYQAEAGTLPEQSDLDDDMLHEEFNWLHPLYVRPYWRRVWIVQELVLARVVVVYCGDKSIDFDDIYGLSLDWGSFEQGFDTANYQKLKPHTRGWNTIQTIRGHRRRREVVEWEMGGEALSIKMSKRGDVATLDEVIEVYAQHQECRLPKDKVYGFRELVPQWKENLVVDYKRSDLEVFLDVAKLDLFEPKMHGGPRVAFRLWSAMGLGDSEEKFNDCLQ